MQTNFRQRPPKLALISLMLALYLTLTPAVTAGVGRHQKFSFSSFSLTNRSAHVEVLQPDVVGADVGESVIEDRRLKISHTQPITRVT